MKKNIKLKIFILILISGFFLFLFFMLKSYNYEKEYKVNGYKIIEKYNKDTKYYTFLISDDKITYPFMINNKYLNKRKLIDNIKVLKNDDEICILPQSEDLEFYPLCSKDNIVYSYNISNKDDKFYAYKKVKQLEKEYQNIQIKYINDLAFLVYNYKGFYLINNAQNKEIKLFDRDIYNLELVYQLDNYLLIPDYNEDYHFNKIFVINILDGKVEEITSKDNISFSSIFLGDYKNKVYLLDTKSEKEYEINIKKNKINKVDIQILENNKMVKKNFKELVANNLNFLRNNVIKYEVINNNLYESINNFQIKISDKLVTKIIKNADDTVYYLVDDNLYMYNNIYGEVLLLSNFEWNFNNTNIVFIKE